MHRAHHIPTELEKAIQIKSVEKVRELVNLRTSEGRHVIDERPIYSLFLGIHESHFQGIDLLEIQRFKTYISKIFTGDNDVLPSDLSNLCMIAELLIANPAEALMKKIDEESSSPYKKFYFLPFFAWAAVHNRADLLNSAGYAQLFVKYPQAAGFSILIAAVFGSKEYVRNAISPLSVDIVRTALSIAAANHDHEMLVCIGEVIGELGLTLKHFSHDSVGRGAPQIGSVADEEPLFWLYDVKTTMRLPTC